MAILPKDADILPPSDDHIFKTLLTHPDAERVLIAVISAAIERTVISVKVRNTELPAMYTGEKAERLDVNCVVDGGDQVNVEMHSSRIEEPVKGEHLNFKNKYTFYAMDLHTSQPSKGKSYSDLVRTYQITFCNYTVLPDRPSYVNKATLRFEDGVLFSDQVNIIFVEMDKLNAALNKNVSELTPLEYWSIFFGYAPDKKYRDLINHIIETKEEVKMAAALLQEISRDEAELARYRSRRMFETDMESNILTAKKLGKELGKEEERERWQTVVARKDQAIVEKDRAITEKDRAYENALAELEKYRAQFGRIVG